jgi:AbrB family looped-hinge helix DNA binding protein
MRTTIDSAGRLVVPKPFREALGAGRGGTVEIDLVDGQVIVSAPESSKRVVQREGRSVIVADEPCPPLTDELVSEVLRAVRR